MAGLLALVGCADRSRTGEEPAGGPYGTPCAENGDCASGACLFVDEPFCTEECPDDCACPAGAVCTRVGDALSVCAPGENSCVSPTPDGGIADAEPPPVVDSGPTMSGGGPGDACRADDDCRDVRSGGGTGPRPEFTMVPQECFSERATGLPGGFCSMTGCVMNVRRDPCPTGTECVNLTSDSVCMVECDSASDCRGGWACRTDIDSVGGLCWPSCTRTGCAPGTVCQADGSCAEPVVDPVDYDVTMRSATLGPALTGVDGTDPFSLTFALPFAVQFFSETYPAGTDVAASWQGLFSFDDRGIMAFVPGDRTRYVAEAPLIVAHHFTNTRSRGGSISYLVSGTAPSRTLEVEWTTTNLSGTGGARFRLRFDEGSAPFVVHYGSITDDVFVEAWTQLAMLDTAQYEEVVVSTGSPTPSTRANTEFTYTPR